MANPEKQPEEKTATPAEISRCVDILEQLVRMPSLLASLPESTRVALLKASGELSRPGHTEKLLRKNELKKAKRQNIQMKERQARALTGIRQARTETIFRAPKQISNAPEIPSSGKMSESLNLESPRNCYICKAEFTRLHFFYDSMCPECADFNYKKRFQTTDLTGRVAVITGARLKIGYQAALMMLRSGARVIVTTRFPVDASLRFSREEDFHGWKDMLQVFGLDLRHTPSVEIFCSYLEQNLDRLDILINNAAQTVRRPPGFYAHLMETENTPIGDLSEEVRLLMNLYRDCQRHLSEFSGNSLEQEKALPVSWQGQHPGMGITSSAKLSKIPYTHDASLVSEEVFPAGKLDADLQQIDLRKNNSWRLRLGEIPTSEMIEIQLVNSIAPFVLCNRLVSIMRRDYTGQKHIVNVSAMEGKFLRFKKSERHPHTNMAKAALNMLTHTSAADFARDGIFMNAVDTGWVTDEDPVELSLAKQEKHDFQPPLDIVDGAARVCDPFIDGINTGHHQFGKFLKDYKPIDW